MTFMMHLYTRLVSLCKRPPAITNIEQLRAFMIQRSALICGETIVKYAQKRLGKLHYTLAKTNDDYGQDLINCQAQLHAEVLTDLYYILCRALNANQHSSGLQSIVIDVHNAYIASAPAEYDVCSFLVPSVHFAREHTTLSELAQHTGKTLFQLLPVRDDLLPGNIKIFQGQMRFAYIAFLEAFDKRAKIAELTQAIHQANTVQELT